MKHWQQFYADGVPHDIDPDVCPSIVYLFEQTVEKYPNEIAFECFGMGMTYAEVEQQSRHFAAYLQQTLGIKRGDRVALMCPNFFAFPVAMFGILRAGGCQVNVNPIYTARELEHQLIDSGAETIVIFNGSTPALAEIVANTAIKQIITVSPGDGTSADLPSPAIDDRLSDTISMSAALSAGAEMTFSPVELTGEDLLFFQYTGGTTGPSKGAVLSHRNVVANLEQYKAAAPGAVSEREEVVLLALPLYHIFGLVIALAYSSIGSRMILIPNPRDAEALINAIKTAGVTVFPAVNTLFAGLAMHPATAEVDFSKLKLSLGSGASILASVSERWKEITGKHITEAYGMSEASPLVSINALGGEVFSGSSGLPAPSIDVKLLDEHDNEVPIGERGEIVVSGPNIMRGYWQKPEANAAAFTADGYFRSGDIGVFDENGQLFIVDRKKDMIIVSGFNVFPNEIEAVVAELDAVAEVACIGVPDPKSGEAVAIFVVTKPGSTLDDAQIIDHCRQAMVGYKVPKQIHHVAELPKSAVGKILRRELRKA